MKIMKTYFYLTKNDPMTVYFKCKDKTGRTFTSSLSDAMRFNSRNDAIDYNYKWLYGDCKGFNLGAIFHAAQIVYKDNGFMPLSDVLKLKQSVPEDMRDYCRMTGTQSNNMNLYVSGYGDLMFEQQLKNLKIKQPTSSYWLSFVDFYQKWGFKGASITINVNESFNDSSKMVNIIDVLNFLTSSGVNIVSIELGNELYYYQQYTGLLKGSPNTAERIKLGKTTKIIEASVLNNVSKLVEHLKTVSKLIKDNGYNQPLGVGVSAPVAMRERLFTQAIVQDNSYYDFIAPHIYVEDTSEKGIMSAVNSVLSSLPKGIEKRVTEFNYNYQANTKGHSSTNEQVLRSFEKAFNQNGVEGYYFHCLWNRMDINGYSVNVLPNR